MRHQHSRRDFFRGASAFAALAALPDSKLTAAPAVAGIAKTDVKSVERIWVDLPYRPVPKRHMHRERPGWTLFEVTKATLANGVTGFGESMVQYGGQALSDSIIARVVGRSAAESMWDDSIGTGLQMALFDAVGKTNGVPVHSLLGHQVRDRAFLSWWACDQPGGDWVLECKDALARGYTAFKAKARSWFDLDEQCRILTPTLPDHFQIDFDFNSLLLDLGHAGPYLTSLEKYKHMAIFESPIPQGDVEGNKLLRRKTRIPIAMHYGSPPIMTALREEVCDGFVIGGGASRVLNDGTIAGAANKPFWLQLVGTGITATWGMHLAAVLTHARWPAINCNHLFENELIKPAIKVENGTAAIPEGPGLGVELDEDAVARYRIEPLKSPRNPPRNILLSIRYPSGATGYYVSAAEYRADFLAGKLPVFPAGIYLEEIPNNGSAEWKELHARALKGGFQVGGRPL
ncbi:MAG: mandelate racemase/muconate lactonizing enzyme family protein [Bryobacterales bacterium]|nr:mandelate racemase/muconate lactonizing enzyme family protein [Bryobacterales bacterium]